jgi:hypothetical protein
LRSGAGWLNFRSARSDRRSLHRDVDVSFVIVPVKGETAVEFAGPVDGQFVIGADGINEMLGIGFGEVLDAKVVDA